MIGRNYDEDRATVSGGELARRLGLSANAIAKLGSSGVAVKADRGKFLLWPSTRAIVAHLSASAAGRDSPVTQERVRLLKMRADSAELALERERKLWLPAAEVERGLSAVMGYLRRTMLAVPSRLSGVDRRVMAEVDREIRAALNQIADGRGYGGAELRPDSERKDDQHGI